MTDEIWKDIKGFEGIYQVSNKGRVRSLDRFVKYVDRESVFKKGEIRKQVLLKKWLLFYYFV